MASPVMGDGDPLRNAPIRTGTSPIRTGTSPMGTGTSVIGTGTTHVGTGTSPVGAPVAIVDNSSYSEVASISHAAAGSPPNGHVIQNPTAVSEAGDCVDLTDIGPELVEGGRGSSTESTQQNFSEFAAVVYRRLKVYRGIYIFYSITSFMLGLPVTVTGFKKQFFPEPDVDLPVEALYCPHYLGIVSLLSCIISLWTALKSQIFLCVLTLVSGLVTVIAAMVVLVTTALQLTNDAELHEMERHANQQTHVIFIFSIGLLIGALAIVITAMSHLSGRRGKRALEKGSMVSHGDNNNHHKLSDAKLAPLERAEVELLGVQRASSGHRHSFASTISNLIRHELRDSVRGDHHRRPERVKKTLSCPNDQRRNKLSDSAEQLEVNWVHPHSSTRSLPVVQSAEKGISVPAIDIEGVSEEGPGEEDGGGCVMDCVIESVRAEGEEVLKCAPDEQTVVKLIDFHAKESVV